MTHHSNAKGVAWIALAIALTALIVAWIALSNTNQDVQSMIEEEVDTTLQDQQINPDRSAGTTTTESTSASATQTAAEATTSEDQ